MKARKGAILMLIHMLRWSAERCREGHKFQRAIKANKAKRPTREASQKAMDSRNVGVGGASGNSSIETKKNEHTDISQISAFVPDLVHGLLAVEVVQGRLYLEDVPRAFVACGQGFRVCVQPCCPL